MVSFVHISLSLVVTVHMAKDHYIVGEGDGLKEVCVVMEGQAVSDVTVQVSTRNDTAFCK